MQKTREELKQLYVIDDAHAYMQVIDERDKNHAFYPFYLRQISRLKHLLPLLPTGGELDVIDIGCGNGLLADLIAKNVKTYTGVDFSKEFIEIAKVRHNALGNENTHFHCSDIVEFSQDMKYRKKFNVCFAMDFTEHVYDDQLVEIFTAATNMLKDDGKLVIHTPNANFLLEILKNKGIMTQLEGHIGVRKDKELIKLFSKAGFEAEKINYLAHYNKLLRPWHLLSRVPLIGKLFEARLLMQFKKTP